MQYKSYYHSPLGNLLLAADDCGLTGIWFKKQRYFPQNADAFCEREELPIFKKTKQWLDLYFAGENPSFIPSFHFDGTDFQNAVWHILCEIPYGTTVTYGEIAQLLKTVSGSDTASARAVGGAVGRNPISIIVPCHRVIGADGSFTGYAGGIDRKIALLQLEGIEIKALSV